MSDKTDRYALPLLAAGQAQKDVTHNEALALIDGLLHPAAQAIGVNTPPLAPMAGQGWIVGAAPTGAWSGHAHALAVWTGGGWRFAASREGMRVWIESEQLWAERIGGAWRPGDLRCAHLLVGGDAVVGPRQPGVAAPSSGTVIDVEARAAFGALIARLVAHGLIDA